MSAAASAATSDSVPQTDTQTAASETAVQSPDVAAWTSHLIIMSRGKKTTHGSEINRFAASVLGRTSKIASSLTNSALRFLGTPYVFGGTSANGFDCSGFTQHVFALLGVSIPRTADAQFYAGRPARGGPHIGDLVFFQTYEPGPSHVGIYIGKGRFVHASSSHGVMVSTLGDPYWGPKYLGAKRLMPGR